ncbi:MAG: hypothetical protein IJB01_04860 [Bacteroidaceae bacterium]|nr:hypothetical protein [Bacteroidaceae bacterium]
MKNLFKNSYIALAVLALGFNACTEEIEYSPAENPVNEQVYFANTNGAQIDIALDAKSFDVAVNRAVAGAAANIDITVTADSLANTIFEFPETVEFADSATTAIYTVAVKDGAVLEYDVYHNITIAVDESLATPYGNCSYSFEVGVPAPWGEWAPIKGHEDGTFNFSLYVSGSYPIGKVLYREHMIDQTRAQFLLQLTAIGANEDMIVDYNKETHQCQVGVHYFLDSDNYGPVFVSDMPHYPLQPGIPYDNYPCSFNPETGVMSLNLIYFVSTELGSSASGYFAQGVETMQLSGYKQYDYSLAMQYRGHYIDNNGVDNAVISATKGADVTKYLMTVVGEDADLNATMSGMLDGTVPCDTLTESGFYAYPISASGNYVALAITLDAEGSAMDAYAEEFEFYLAGQENPWVSLGYAKYTDDIVLPSFGNNPMTYYVEVLENKDMPGLFRMVDPYGPEQPLYPYASSYKEGSYIEIDATDPEGVWIEGWQSTGLDIQNNGLMEITSKAWYQANEQGATKEDAKEAGLCGIYADGVITFPPKGLLIGIGSSAYYANTNGAFALDMTNLLDSIPEEEGGESAAPAARMGMKFHGEAMGKVTRFKKIDSSFMTPVDAELK